MGADVHVSPEKGGLVRWNEMASSQGDPSGGRGEGGPNR